MQKNCILFVLIFFIIPIPPGVILSQSSDSEQAVNKFNISGDFKGRATYVLDRESTEEDHVGFGGMRNDFGLNMKFLPRQDIEVFLRYALLLNGRFFNKLTYDDVLEPDKATGIVNEREGKVEAAHVKYGDENLKLRYYYGQEPYEWVTSFDDPMILLNREAGFDNYLGFEAGGKIKGLEYNATIFQDEKIDEGTNTKESRDVFGLRAKYKYKKHFSVGATHIEWIKDYALKYGFKRAQTLDLRSIEPFHGLSFNLEFGIQQGMDGSEKEIKKDNYGLLGFGYWIHKKTEIRYEFFNYQPNFGSLPTSVGILTGIDRDKTLSNDKTGGCIVIKQSFLDDTFEFRAGFEHESKHGRGVIPFRKYVFDSKVFISDLVSIPFFYDLVYANQTELEQEKDPVRKDTFAPLGKSEQGLLTTTHILEMEMAAEIFGKVFLEIKEDYDGWETPDHLIPNKVDFSTDRQVHLLAEISKNVTEKWLVTGLYDQIGLHTQSRSYNQRGYKTVEHDFLFETKYNQGKLYSCRGNIDYCSAESGNDDGWGHFEELSLFINKKCTVTGRYQNLVSKKQEAIFLMLSYEFVPQDTFFRIVFGDSWPERRTFGELESSNISKYYQRRMIDPETDKKVYFEYVTLF